MATAEQERAYLAQFETVSNEQIRQTLTHGFVPGEFTHALTMYLSKRELTASSEQIEIARRASDAADRAAAEATRASDATERQATAAERQAVAAERANTRATLALVFAIISIIFSAKDIWMPLLESHK